MYKDKKASFLQILNLGTEINSTVKKIDATAATVEN